MLFLSLIYLLSFIYWGPKLNRKQKIFFAALPFVLINFLRFGYGADYFSYERIYNEINMQGINQALITNSDIEPIYILLNYFSNILGIHYHIFAGILTSFMSVLTVYWLVDYSPKFEWSILLFYVMHYPVWTLSAIRQGLTIIILFYVLFNRKEFSLKTKIIVSIISIGIHFASIILIGIYLISSLKWKGKYFLYILFLLPFARIILQPNVLILFQNIPAAGKVVKTLLKYLGENSISLFGFTSLVRMFFLAVVWYHYDQLITKYPKYRIMFNYTILSFLLYLFIPFSTVIATRVTVYGYFLTIIVFPMIMGLYSNSNYKKIVASGLLAFSIFSFYNEFDKMRNRSGYEESLLALNFETIFNKDYKKFNRQFSLHNQIYYSNKAKYKNSKVLDKVYLNEVSVESKYDVNDSYYSVAFPNINGLAVINDQGLVVETPRVLLSLNVIGDILEYVQAIPNTYTYSSYSPIGQRIGVSDEKVRTEITKYNQEQYERKIARTLSRQVSLEWIKESSLLNDYMLEPVEFVYLHSDTYGSKHQYLEIRTSYRSYFALLDADGELMVDTWYNRIIPEDHTGLVVGYTSFGKEYINEEGQVFWIDPSN